MTSQTILRKLGTQSISRRILYNYLLKTLEISPLLAFIISKFLILTIVFSAGLLEKISIFYNIFFVISLLLFVYQIAKSPFGSYNKVCMYT